MAEELEKFEEDLKSSRLDNFEDLDKDLMADDDPDPKEGDTGEPGEPKEETIVKDTTEEDETKDKVPDASDQPEVKYVTLPEDAESFGELAGKKITYQELQEANLVDKLVTWGHQGRHLVQRGQEELEETKKIRELLEKQLTSSEETRKAAEKPPDLAPDKAAEALVNHYGGDFDALGEAGAIEPSFFATYPKVAAQLEHRFRATAELGQVVIAKVTELLEGHERRSGAEAQVSGESRLTELMTGVAESGELFELLNDAGERKDFMKWATADGNTLNWVDKDLSKVTDVDISSSFLLYMHQNPDKFKAPEKAASKEERQKAGGGGGGAPAKKKAPMDEMQQFITDLAESGQDKEY
ncbi:MAG: hypothetical protein KAJ06_09280 [Gammaproteobacteria bacterium]|nr:hypothetical protein [Gammaproteobacteria bacterium]